MDWFSKLTPAAKRAYIKAHPNSKYAKARRLKRIAINGPMTDAQMSVKHGPEIRRRMKKIPGSHSRKYYDARDAVHNSHYGTPFPTHYR